ncbi:lipopolysaccharide kinase InaA family protein [Gillisia sp. Hel_I_86]|uniref:lipopolysaccharide kinase InaA family protein n=1 Tax=Gillisia sp. Hel_I_86 TaxID=1249981 RepID=UPI0011A1BF9D|nr:lipopolysaccharide kinase InaA family protein [Gillisia sp. Hel_I_86]
MHIKLSEEYQNKRDTILEFVLSFDNMGTLLGSGARNKIKLFDLNGKILNIKSFKVPNKLNQVIYKYFRKSKAERSFEYAQILMSKNIGTPAPVAYALNKSSSLFNESFYISEHLKYDLTYRELVTNPNLENHEEILRAFTQFTYKLHENGIEFLDHSPGNTLIQINNKSYDFFLVDLNRMNFKKMNFEERMKNFSRLTPKKEMVEFMADEYSNLIEEDSGKVFEKMWFYTSKFQEGHLRKKRLKEKFKL